MTNKIKDQVNFTDLHFVKLDKKRFRKTSDCDMKKTTIENITNKEMCIYTFTKILAVIIWNAMLLSLGLKQKSFTVYFCFYYPDKVCLTDNFNITKQSLQTWNVENKLHSEEYILYSLFFSMSMMCNL